MALLPNKANSETNNEKLDDRSPLPAGDYLCVIKKADFKQTKAKTGHYLNCQFVVAEGVKKGSSFFVNLNLDNPNPVAVDIANKELNSICDALDLTDVEDSDEILGQELGVTLKITPGDASYPPSNETTAYFPADEYEESDSDEVVEESEAEVEQEAETEEPASTKTETEQAEDTPGTLPWE